MSGYLMLGIVGALAFVGLVALRVPRTMWSVAGAALFLGAAGYAWQGDPGLPARPATPNAQAIPVAPADVALREQLMGRFTQDTAYITASDAMLRAGDAGAAVNVIMGGLRGLPRSFILWTQLGSVLTIHDGDQVTPPARLAFVRAMQLAPDHPAPAYYAGMAYLRAGDLAATRRLWQRALRLSNPDTGYRRIIAEQLMVLDRLMAMTR